MNDEIGQDKHRMDSEDGVLLPASGRFRNSGILMPDVFWTFDSPESPPVPVKSSLRAILDPDVGRVREGNDSEMEDFDANRLN